MVKQNKIRNAVILSGIGSVSSYRFHVVNNCTLPPKNILVKKLKAPADIASMNAYVINRRVHAHVTFSNADKAFGGHLEAGTNVFRFAVITMGVLSDSADLTHVDDVSYR
jgi:predicted DNA-binding protein with PD1-like motif